jgi:putative transferase (TIGR04331 family)
LHLITSSDERTWKKGRPVIFLDERCRPYNQKNTWLKMDAIVAKPFGLGNKKVEENALLKKQLTKDLFPILYKTLNQFHNTDYNERFWRIVVGHWLAKYISVIINRVGAIEQCLSSHSITTTAMFQYDEGVLTKNDITSFVQACGDDEWNNSLYQYIFNNLNNIDFDIEIISGNPRKIRRLNTVSKRKKYKDLIYKAIFNVLNLFSRKEDGVIINSYIPKIYEAKLCLALGQVPLFRRTQEYHITKEVDYKYRKNLSNKNSKNMNNSIDYISRKLLFQLLPVCYLEGFSEMIQEVENLPWPKTPKFIFTSNSFILDEIFKLWTATKISNGSTYFIGQHGNNYGTSKYSNPSIEQHTSDKFITWGWGDSNQNTIPAFIFTSLGKNNDYDPSGGVLLIQDMMYGKHRTWDGSSHFVAYLKDLSLFVKGLNMPIKDSLTIRLHSASRHYDDSEKRWKDYDKNVSIDPGTKSIDKVIKKNRLIIHGYDSTGILETLSQNIPTLALLNFGSYGNNGDGYLIDSAKPYYDLLINAGIIHLNTESLYKKVNGIFYNVESWWNQDSIQNARIAFCDKYAKKSTNPVNDLKYIIESHYNK